MASLLLANTLAILSFAKNTDIPLMVAGIDNMV